MELPSPGDIIVKDYRDVKPSAASDRLRIVTWNIERGYKLPGIIEELKRIDADIIALQEIDIGCDRSNGADTGSEIAEALQMNYIFFTEFEELRSDVRDAQTQGGGVHGNGILTKFDILQSSLVRHSVQPVDWNDLKHPLARKEPRRGERAVLRVILDIPTSPSVVVYCAHFEVFCGMLSRIQHLGDIFEDARSMIDQGYEHIVIAGDLNTMAHGIARFSPKFCTDRMRFLSFGYDEGQMWDRYLLPVVDPLYKPKSSSLPVGEHNTTSINEQLDSPEARKVNTQLLYWGVDATTAAKAVNPHFIDPFPSDTVTLDHPSYRLKIMGKHLMSFMKGKLDWLLLRSLVVVEKHIGNHEFEYSDHKWLSVDVECPKTTTI